MFVIGFVKQAATIVTMSPEDYYDIVREKDPYMGGLAGAAAGAAAGAIKGAKGRRHKNALIGAGVGAGAGVVGGHAVSRAVGHYQARKVRRIADDLKLKSTPSRKKNNV
jgi:hypothetical protein